ncbi:hypothetical protein BIY24_13750 [Halobacteriovorax marinus]|uniref:transposase n=1 Tax=Halobacteriovorax marinus TaxID=97084 RepID=UPI000BC2F0D6|nr:transposase [Halobacteriovorax marinus]ATH08973.1 hypothetical protein BIY24_13750 [Halobacteriovorax marinus]
MGRRPTIRENKYPYHIVARAHNKEWFPLPIDQMWSLYIELLEFLMDEFDVRIYAFTLMNNHYHLMIQTPLSNIDIVMYWFMKKSTLRVQRKTSRINSIYGGRYKSSLLIEPTHRLNTYKYILRNPVKAHITKKCEYYPFSICEHFQSDVLKIEPLVDLKDHGLVTDQKVIDWLNVEYSEEEDHSIRTGLKRPIFSYAKNNNTKKQIKPNLFIKDA